MTIGHTIDCFQQFYIISYQLDQFSLYLTIIITLQTVYEPVSFLLRQIYTYSDALPVKFHKVSNTCNMLIRTNVVSALTNKGTLNVNIMTSRNINTTTCYLLYWTVVIKIWSKTESVE